MIENPAEGGVLPVRAVLGVSLSGGVGPQQVVQQVTARGLLCDQVRAGQLAPMRGAPGRGRRAARLAAAGRLISGPGWIPSSRNSRAAGALTAS